MKLTIGITTMPSRAYDLEKLIGLLGMQDFRIGEFKHEAGEVILWGDVTRSVEVLAYLTPAYDKKDDRLTYGEKRNAVLRIAQGEYIAFHDDDDEPHPQYINNILKALESGPDVVGFKVACYGYANNCQSPEIMEPADVSIKYPGWANDQNGFRYVRYPHHLAPTKTEHARAIGYRGHYGEDHDYSVRMQAAGLLKTEAYIDEWMYTYLFNAKKKPGQ